MIAIFFEYRKKKTNIATKKTYGGGTVQFLLNRTKRQILKRRKKILNCVKTKVNLRKVTKKPQKLNYLTKYANSKAF